MQFKNLLTGDPAPFFSQRSSANPKFHFDTAAGRYIVLCFLVTAGDEQGRRALEVLDSHRRMFDDERVSFFGISHDPRDESEGRLQQQLPGIRYFWDFDGSIGRLYGSLPTEIQDMRNIPARRFWLVLDPALRVIASIGFREDGSDRKELIDTLEGLPAPGVIADREIQAPVLLLPGVFEPEFARD
jgi:peroxiredoxin